MTRTERSAFPRAVLRDRSLSKSGLEKSLRKDGGGAHNWGRLDAELDHEYGALDDDLAEDGEATTSSDAAEKNVASSPTSSFTEEEIEAAKKFRKHALKGEIDLSSIARTSNAVSSSPPKSAISDTASNASA